MFRLVSVLLILSLSACVGPLVPVIKLDNESAVRLRREIKVYENQNLQNLEFTRLGRMKATSCMNKMWDPPASEENAVDQLRYKASALGANAITNVLCEDREGTNIAKNCWTSVTCYATAILVAGSTESISPEQKAVRPVRSSGTGFVVTSQGYVITNSHVVEGCSKALASNSGVTYDVQVVRLDPLNDLALLKLTNWNAKELSFRSGKRVRAGDTVVVVGFALTGLLSQEPHVTSGTVTALAGIKDDTRYLQISAPVQPGNSGAPLFDEEGNIVGVVVAKLDALKVAKATGDIPQNVNFAINAAVVKTFLEANGIEYSVSAPNSRLATADIAEKGRKGTVLVQCNK